MNKLILIFALLIPGLSAAGQKFSISNDRENIFYKGIDNPVSVAVEMESVKSLIIKTDNGAITGTNGSYIFRPERAGKADLIIFKNSQGYLKEIGRTSFRVKNLGDPTFMIGSRGDTISTHRLAAQQVVHAELDGKYGFDIRFKIESFEVYILRSGTSYYTIINNPGHIISDQLRQQFATLGTGDVLVFKKIIITGPTGRREIEPKVVSIL